MDPKKLEAMGAIFVSVAILIIFGSAYAICLYLKLSDQLAAFAQAAINLAMLVGGYWLGSSSSSRKKDDVIADRSQPPTVVAGGPTIVNPPAPEHPI